LQEAAASIATLPEEGKPRLFFDRSHAQRSGTVSARRRWIAERAIGGRGIPRDVPLTKRRLETVHSPASTGRFSARSIFALKKAKTAVLFGMNSEAVGEFCKPGARAQGLAATNDVLVVFAGGIPIRNEAGKVIGGVGVSGGAVDQDYAVALAAAAAPIT
jgi:uncharacterized protein (UPF0303 family)